MHGIFRFAFSKIVAPRRTFETGMGSIYLSIHELFLKFLKRGHFGFITTRRRNCVHLYSRVERICKSNAEQTSALRCGFFCKAANMCGVLVYNQPTMHFVTRPPSHPSNYTTPSSPQ